MPEVIAPPVQPMKRRKPLTQYQKIVKLMCQAHEDKWFYPYDFMSQELGDLFVGYKAPTRLNELETDYPELFERELEGKYVKRRINRLAIDSWFSGLSKDLRQIVAKELNYYPYGPAE